jgi:transcriptional regulator with XRE-family HTH domain
MSRPATVTDLLRNAGLTYRSAAAKARIGFTTIFRMTHGTVPHASTLIQLAGALGVSVPQLEAAIAASLASRKRARAAV